MEDPNFNIHAYNALDYSLDGLNFQSFSSSESYSSYPNFGTPKCAPHDHHHQLVSTTVVPTETPHHHHRHQYEMTAIERPSKQLKSSNSWNSCTTDQISAKASSSSSSHLISFDAKPKNEVGSNGDVNVFPSSTSQSPKFEQGLKSSTTAVAAASRRSAIHAHDHVLAERKRREKLSQRFIALSALVPGLKKVLTPPTLILFSIKKIIINF